MGQRWKWSENQQIQPMSWENQSNYQRCMNDWSPMSSQIGLVSNSIQKECTLSKCKHIIQNLLEIILKNLDIVNFAGTVGCLWKGILIIPKSKMATKDKAFKYIERECHYSIIQS